MAYNGNGVFNLYTPGNPTVTGTTISSTWANNTLSDIATGLSTALTKDGQTTPTANIPLGGFKLTGVGLGTVSTDAATLANLQAATGTYVATVGGTADVITLTPSPAITAYAAGQIFSFIASGANTTTVTVNVSGLGAKAVTKNGATALDAGDIPASAIITIVYDGTQFQIVRNGAAGLSANTFTGTQTIVSTDAGAAAGPDMEVYRNSATPAANDAIGQFLFTGEDSGGNKITYASIGSAIVDPTDGSEDSTFAFRTVNAGTLAARVVVGQGIYTPAATGGDQGSNTINASGIYDDGVQILPRVTNASVATTSGTSVTLTSVVPTWATKITLGFVGVSTNGTNNLLIQVGPTSGVVGSGYLGCGSLIPNGSSPVGANQTAGFAICGSNTAASVYHGIGTLTLQNLSTNTWSWSFTGGRSDGAASCVAGGSISLAGALEDIAVTSVGGTDAYDAGSINVSWE